jgi:hypothetical protein
MTETLPDRAVRAFEGHDAFERDGRWFEVTTTRFDGRVTAAETDEWALSYTLEVRAPMLSAATEGGVGPAVEAGWFDTYELRLEDTDMAVRQDVEFDDYRLVEEADDDIVERVPGALPGVQPRPGRLLDADVGVCFPVHGWLWPVSRCSLDNGHQEL